MSTMWLSVLTLVLNLITVNVAITAMGWRRKKRGPWAHAVNVVHGRVLPLPSDPRWSKGLHGFQIGSIVVTSTRGLLIDGNFIHTDEAERYAESAYRCISGRLLDRAEAETLGNKD